MTLFDVFRFLFTNLSRSIKYGATIKTANIAILRPLENLDNSQGRNQ
jgi:hypothetical protein